MVLGVETGADPGEACRRAGSALSPAGHRSAKVTAVSPLLPQCFLNAVLQCLSSTRPLRDFCLRRDFRQEVPGGGRAQELTEGGQQLPILLFSLPQPLQFYPPNSHGSQPFKLAVTSVFPSLFLPRDFLATEAPPACLLS